MAHTWQLRRNDAGMTTETSHPVSHHSIIATLLALTVLILLLLLPLVALSADPCPVGTGDNTANPCVVGQTVVNPVTGATETILNIDVDRPNVYTTVGNAIFVGNAAFITTVPDPADDTKTLNVTEVHTSTLTGLPYELVASDGKDPPRTVVIRLAYVADDRPFDPGQEGGVPPPPPVDPVADLRNVVDRRYGPSGAAGKDGGGLRICIIWCFTIGVNPTAGGAGYPGPTINRTITGDYITTISPKLPGVWIASTGGNGGNGGDAYGNMPATAGGAGGAGGNVTVTSNVSINTGPLGDHSYGMFVQSQAGSGGKGGTGYILSSGGSGGTPAQGGPVLVTNNGSITTQGVGATGILAQSLGGGGGSGGSSYGIVGDAGSGYAGGDGGRVEVQNNGTITTSGVAAHGINAQSIGGTGGDGGTAGALVSLGGKGDAGGDGGKVVVSTTERSSITTQNTHSIGILAQSIGGGGGNGGSAYGIYGVGGSVSGGGNADDVSVTNAGRIATTTTTGAESHGIVAQSIGGGGGTGGTGGGLVAEGGVGGTGEVMGNAGDVAVTNTATGLITTAGVRSHGVLAQSIGGGGGTAGISAGLVAIGGQGSAGGQGGDVDVDNAGRIITSGEGSKGVLAQSIGGGGGSARASGGLVAIGGDSGAGGDSDPVSVINSGSIATSGNFGDAVFAQSIGGGGGDAGDSSGLFAIGGTGDKGGEGDTVGIENSGSILTQGSWARGVLAQSIGGGGGSGGDAGSGIVGIGGSGAGGGTAKAVTVSNTGVITTRGNVSNAIEAQSIGGGGGSGGTSGGGLFTLGGDADKGGDGGIVNVAQAGELYTFGNDSHGIFAQSIGGGGGSGGNASSVSAFAGVAIGGDGGAGGKGDAVNVSLDYGSTIETSGDRAKGILAQSVGGGGGSGGFAAQGTVGYGLSVSVAIGGTGDKGGDGGSVNLTGFSDVATDGADSDGVLVQSVGGGGGNGGFAISMSAAGGDTGAAAVGVGIGGGGGTGGVGGTVTVNAGGSIHTQGAQSEGLIAQSVGGGGGTGGFVVTMTAAGGGVGAGAVSVGVGGGGGDGGDAGLVNARWRGDVTTAGIDSNAMLIQGVGGGGGNGGFNVSAAVAAAGAGAGGVAVGVGGSGGKAGLGGVVNADVTGDITTTGARSSGLVVQSIGGRGGNGGFNISGAVAASGGAAGAVSVGVGGSGGEGGGAREVTARYEGVATTAGEDSDAVMFQSVGGGGGNGAFNIGGVISASTSAGAGVSVGVGGSGAGAGSGGTVTGTASGDLTTYGDRSNAFVAQSLGGGGGNGGFNVSGGISASAGTNGAVSVGVGGSGGGGGDGGVVDATFYGTATTYGEDATAIVAQSLGGGGGNGGLNVSGAIAAGLGPTGTVSVGVGGSGGVGGIGKEATLNSIGDVMTQGAGAGGVLVQSVGGGGGTGGINVSGGFSVSFQAAGTVVVGVGGSGGGGGAAGLVTSSHEGDVWTRGDDANAYTVQSIGGGGGSGGINVSGGVTGSLSGSGSIAVGVGGAGAKGGLGGEVLGTLRGDAVTWGDRSTAVLMQSVGGGGGAGGLNVSGAINVSKDLGGAVAIGVGGSGGDGEGASQVTGDITGFVGTFGNDATGVLVQSVGGGGGRGGVNVSGALALSLDSTAAASIGVGGFGGKGGDAGEVSLVRTGTTWTEGANSDAIVVQSVGGGGGNGGVNVSGALSFSPKKDAVTATVGLGGFAGGGGTGKDVTATITGDVIATGADAPTYRVEDGLVVREIKNGSNAIVAQSLGGSGGNGATNVSGGIALDAGPGKSMALNVGVGGFGGSGGDAGDVDLVVTSNEVVAVGDGHTGIIAQSIGGGGGNGGLNVSAGIVLNGQITAGIGGFGGEGGVGGDVDATADANITAIGAGSIGFLAQSVGGGGGNGGINISGGIRPMPNSNQSASSLIFGLGGAAGDGNTSGNVVAHQSGSVYVEGEGAIGVLAQSIAGGGGNGGLNVSGNLSGGKGYAAAIGVGGTGGEGATAGNVTLVSDGEIVVDGGLAAPAGSDLNPEERAALDFRERANGILAQSIGGGGGNGGMNITGAATDKGSPLVVAVGGTGGEGRDAGTVSVTRGLDTPSLLQTSGNGANGITAQSIGGGGGNAGGNLAFELRTDSKTSGQQLLVVVGGGGGEPGHGKQVDVTHVGTIVTDGRQSDGILAQSIGGGGGNANINLGYAYAQGASGINVAVGGAPGAGGDGSTVTVDHEGTIVTEGDNSSAIYAQSVGGGGGDAEANSTTTYETTASMEIAIGRIGGTGGKGGNVDVTSNGDLQTAGDRAVGVFAQSVGNGGGESGSFALGFEGEVKDKKTKEEKEISAALQVGLEGGLGGTGGNVTVDTAGSITTSGEEAHAIQAQSVGGGGGKGGSASSHISTDSMGFNLGVGGTGGEGAVSGTVDVTNSATLTTSGREAHGIFAQSVGGGGGTGGKAGINEFTTPEKIGEQDKKQSYLLNISVGGTGGVGATGNDVTVANSGLIHTTGAKAYGINAQSVGGGGGVGGAVVDESLTIGKTTHTLTVDFGGLGGEGAAGKNVDVVNTGVIYTQGSEATGIRAQSLGGGGGDGGLILNMRASAVTAASSSTAVTVNIGGEGGTGGAGGNVFVGNARTDAGTGGIIVTEGDKAYGIHAQSIGGGGGNGSSIIAANIGSGMSSTLVGLNIGGTGGTGATGGYVEVNNAANIETFGDEAHGIFAQSIGGGGGNGGLALALGAVVGAGSTDRTPMVALGGFGGDGGDAGNVLVTNTGSIVIHGDRAVGIYAQTQSGGGGDAGVGVGLTSGGTTTRIAGAISAVAGAVGAFGVTGGEAGAVGTAVIDQRGDITVLGQNSSATRIENVNGGGGHITLDFSSITSFDPEDLIPDVVSDLMDIVSAFSKPMAMANLAADAPDTTPSFDFRAGGEGLRAMSGGNVAIDYAGDFAVVGDDGAANSAQAVGGGGGTIDLNLGIVDNGSGRNQLFTVDGTLGGLDGQHNGGGAIASRQQGDLLAEGDNTLGLFLQSVGGGGGRANVNVTADVGTFGDASFVLGGTGGLDETGGAVTHEQAGRIATSGDGSHGAVVQSIGGGGGVLAQRVQVAEPAPVVAAKTKVRPAPAARAILGDVPATTTVTLGSTGGSALDAANVAVALDGDASTSGDNATALVLQSIGGGGGSATVLGVDAVNAQLGGSAGASGHGGDIDLDHTGDVTTSGARAHGVLLQSIGGGGGAVFTDVAQPDVTLSSANSGDGGAIDFTQVGDIVTLGDASYGVIAQSLGGGGGFVDGSFAGSAGGLGAGGSISLRLDGNVGTLGDGSNAVFLQSAGSLGGGNISATLTQGHQVIGGVGGTAVTFDGGADNVFDNAGAVASSSGVAGMAFLGGAGNESILNRGIVVGSLDLAGGTNQFSNFLYAVFVPGATVDLGGAGNWLLQGGLFAPAGDDVAQVTQLNGSLRQFAFGRSVFEVDLSSNVVDSVIATGSVELAGELDVALINAAGVMPGTFEAVLYRGEGGLEDAALVVEVQPSVVVSSALLRPDSKTVSLGYTVDFAPTGLAGNRNAIGDYVNRLQLAGSAPGLGGTIDALVSETELDAYAADLTQLGPEFYAEQEAYTLQSVHNFSRSMQDCGSMFVGSTSDKGCLWMRFDYETTDRDADAGFPATEQIARRLSQGMQKTLDSGWTFGVGLDAENNDSTGYDGDWRAQATTVGLGLLGRRDFAGTSVGGVVTFGTSDQDVQRRVSVTESVVASGGRDVTFMSAVVDVDHPIEVGGLRLTPAVDLGVASLKGDSMTESGADGQNLVIEDETETYWWLEPSLLVDTESTLASGKLLRAFARVGALYYLDSASTEVRAGFAAAPSDVNSMHVYSELDDWHFLAEGGLTLVATDRYTLSLSYTFEHSDLRDRGAGMVRVTIPLK